MNLSSEHLSYVASQFALKAIVKTVLPLGEGFINDTFIVNTVTGFPTYILQRKNKQIFPNVPFLVDNIIKVTTHIKNKIVMLGGDPNRETLTLVPTKDRQFYFIDSEDDFWVMTLFIENTITYSSANMPELAFKGGSGLGMFHSLLSDFEGNLNETISGFHNINWRFEQWNKSLANDLAKRKSSLVDEIDFVEARRTEMLDFRKLIDEGIIPTRVTHNDTKISNFLFDKISGNILCAIDLDTVMKGSVLNDFGDAIRSYANAGAEDDKNLDNVYINLSMFRAYAEGYLSQQQNLTESEVRYLAFSVKYITYEQIMRFLMDYIDGDKYYKIKYPEHNLVRTKAQIKLLQSIEKRYEIMQKIIRDIICCK